MNTTTAPSRTDANLATIRRVYDAFGRGDISAFLDTLDPAVAWEHWPDHHGQAAGLPHLQARTGPAGVAEFFRALGDITFHAFEVRSVAAGDDVVFADIAVHLELPGGRHLVDEEVHRWHFGPDGKVTAMRHYLDTAKHIAAFAD